MKKYFCFDEEEIDKIIYLIDIIKNLLDEIPVKKKDEFKKATCRCNLAKIDCLLTRSEEN